MIVESSRSIVYTVEEKRGVHYIILCMTYQLLIVDHYIEDMILH